MSKQIQALTHAILAGPVFMLALTATTANADSIYVCWDGSGDYLTIQEGIDAAQDGDEVVVCDAIYTGPGNKNLDFGGKAITVRSENGPDTCIIDCENDARGFSFTSGETETSVLDGFTIRNGSADYGGGVYCGSSSSPTITNCTISANSAGGSGGGLLCYSASPTITNCTISGNSANYEGGGVYCYQSSPTLTNCTIRGNSANYGGGVYCGSSSSPTITNCTISGNSANYGGGGLHCWYSNPTITNCTISGNWADSGGAVYCHDNSSPTIANCTISGNFAHDEGGAVYCWYSNPTITNCTITGNTAYSVGGGGVSCYYYSSPAITNCTISENSANYGSGVYCNQSSPTITNCTISANSVNYAGGGVYCSSNPTITNCTISANSAEYGGGVYCYYRNPTIANCILWADTPEEIYADSGSPVVTYCDVQGGWDGQGNIDADPLFVDPDGPDDDPNTWEDNDFHLAADSPCIDAGCNWAVPPDTADLDDDGDTTEYTPLDLDGKGRFFDDPNTPDTGCGCPPVVDMGAYEFGGSDPAPCLGDLDCDRDVDQSDLGILLADWGCDDPENGCAGDLDCDGDTDESDLGILLSQWGMACP